MTEVVTSDQRRRRPEAAASDRGGSGIRELPIQYWGICFHRVRATGKMEEGKCNFESAFEKNMYYKGCQKYNAPKRKKLGRGGWRGQHRGRGGGDRR